MEWRDQGALLSVRRHGESSAIIEVFTERHGRHAGMVRGGAGRRMGPVLQPGAQLDLTWRARLEEPLGSFSVELCRSRTGVLHDRLALAGLNSICALLSFSLPERDPHPDFYGRSVALLDALESDQDWPVDYLHWERRLLEEMGFRLDLDACAVTGSVNDLAYVSPSSGRAVSREGARGWEPRLLPLPGCLRGVSGASMAELLEGLRITGHFLESWLAPAIGARELPPARQRLIDALARG